jgi:peroxiredoxin
MTQLVELQTALPKFKQAGMKLYGISYDEPAALAEFARHHGITWRLLSDQGSKVIRRFGILNHHVTEEQIPYYGIPFPGTYIVDEDGIITEKLFSRNLAARSSPELMIDSALGEILLGEDEPSTTGGNDDIRISATFHGGGGTIKNSVVRQLVVRFELSEGLHIYDAPVPEGMVSTRIEVTGPEGVRIGDLIKKPTHPLNLPGLGVELNVWEGRVDFALPIWIDDRIAGITRKHAMDEVPLTVTVHYQACDDQTCRIPQQETLTLSVPVGNYVGHKLAGRLSGANVSSMNTRKYITRMVWRGLLRSPIRGLLFLQNNLTTVRNGPSGRRSE